MVSELIRNPTRRTILEAMGGSSTPEVSEARFRIADKKFFGQLLALRPSLEPFYDIPDGKKSTGFSFAASQLKSWIIEQELLINIIRNYRDRKADGGPQEFVLPWDVMITVEDNGSVRFPCLVLLSHLVNEPGLLQRLRECPVCKNIYWARRLAGRRSSEASTCSESRCSNFYHRARYRVREAERHLGIEQKRLEKMKQFGKTHPLRINAEEKVAEWRAKLRKLKEKYVDI